MSNASHICQHFAAYCHDYGLEEYSMVHGFFCASFTREARRRKVRVLRRFVSSLDPVYLIHPRPMKLGKPPSSSHAAPLQLSVSVFVCVLFLRCGYTTTNRIPKHRPNPACATPAAAPDRSCTPVCIAFTLPAAVSTSLRT